MPATVCLVGECVSYIQLKSNWIRKHEEKCALQISSAVLLYDKSMIKKVKWQGSGESGDDGKGSERTGMMFISGWNDGLNARGLGHERLARSRVLNQQAGNN